MFQKKGILLNIGEVFYIYKEASTNNYLNDTHTIPNSKISETILNGFQDESRWHPAHTQSLPAILTNSLRPVFPRSVPTHSIPSATVGETWCCVQNTRYGNHSHPEVSIIENHWSPDWNGHHCDKREYTIPVYPNTSPSRTHNSTSHTWWFQLVTRTQSRPQRNLK